jgi:HK97 gp10 family phage protein
MADLIEVEITGGDEIQEKLENLPSRIGKAILKKALRAGAEVFRAEMARRAPQGWHVFRTTEYKGAKYKGRSRDFGVLARSIRTSISVRGDELEGTASIGPSRKAFWGLFEEFGRRGARAQPFIIPAFDAAKDRALEAFINTAKEELAANGSPVE